jgi:hypothetical protein
LGNSSKVYVIDPKTGKSGMRTVQGSEKVEYRPESQPGAPLASGDAQKGKAARGTRRQKGEHKSSRSQRKDSAALSLLSYFLGPLAVLATRQSSENKIWITIAAASAVLSVAALWMWRSIFSGPATGSFVDGVWIFMGCLAILTALTTWSNAVLLLGRERKSALDRLPHWIRRPFAAGLLGLIAPGLGLYVTGHNKRAAIALWISGLAVLSALVLSHAVWLWRWNRATGAVAIAPHTLEYVFLTMAAAVLFGVLTWIVQALDGTRLAGARSARQVRDRGDMLAGLLLAAIFVFAFNFEPALVARTFDEFAVAAYAEGFAPCSSERGVARSVEAGLCAARGLYLRGSRHERRGALAAPDALEPVGAVHRGVRGGGKARAVRGSGEA